MFDTLTALYVEDELLVSNMVLGLLQKFFKEVMFAQNGQEGLDIYSQYQDKIDIIITDINMPKMDGLQMCSKVREIDQTIPIIITTAYNDKDFLHQAIELGVSKFVTKPMDMSLLLDSIKKSVEPILLKQNLEKERELYEEERVRNAKFAATGELAAGITHEINTPLTYIKANFEMLGYDIEDLPNSKEKENIQKSLEKINDGLHRIENIVGSMREMSQQSTVNKEKVNIYSTIITAATLAYNKIKHISHVYINGREFNLDMDKNEFEFIAEVQLQRIEQVWIIIINNAMDELMKMEKFDDRKLEISISSEDENIVIVFKDNAGGIDINVMPHIFEPFKGTKKSSGMGIGLSIAKKIVQDQGDCTIEAYNEDNGAVFKITLKK